MTNLVYRFVTALLSSHNTTIRRDAMVNFVFNIIISVYQVPTRSVGTFICGRKKIKFGQIIKYKTERKKKKQVI